MLLLDIRPTITLREEILAGRTFSGKKIWQIWRNLIWWMPKNYKFGRNLIWRMPKNYKFGGCEKNKIIAEFNLANDQNDIYFFKLKNMCYKYKRKSWQLWHLLFVANKKIEGISFEINITVTPVRIMVIVTNINKILGNVRRVHGFTRFTVKLW